jgi:hypothetical protein
MIILPKCIRGSHPFNEFLCDIAVLGVEAVERGGQRYAIVAARSNPRWWLIPLDNRCATSAGFEMIQPVSLFAKLAKVGALKVAEFGPHWLLGKDTLLLSGLPELRETFDRHVSYLSFFTGTDGPHRKTTIQLMDSDGMILGYCKMSRKSHVRNYLRNEADMLARVKFMRLLSADIPSVIAFRDEGSATLLFTDSLKSATHVSPKVLGKDHINFLDELRRHTEYNGARMLLDDLAAQTKNFDGSLSKMMGPEWISRLTSIELNLRPYADKIPLCLCHGDFTPWNTFLQDGRFYVFDWEYARADLPVGFDLVHFILATIPPSHQLRELPQVLKRLASIQFCSNEEAARRALLLSLYCHAIFYLNRLTESQSTLSDWKEGPVRAALIDILLETSESCS